MFRGFTPKSLEFLAELKRRNDREWFETHRRIYEREILEPGRAFVVEMGEHLQALVPTIHADPRVNGSLFRIFRDSRFHRSDLFKDHVGFVFWQGRGRRMQSASFYMHFTPDTLLFAAGIYRFKPAMRDAYREYLRDDRNRAALHAVFEGLRGAGYTLPEPGYKRYPRGFHAGMPHAYLSLYDAVYATKRMAPEGVFFTDALPAAAYDIYEGMFDLQQWVYGMVATAES